MRAVFGLSRSRTLAERSRARKTAARRRETEGAELYRGPRPRPSARRLPAEEHSVQSLKERNAPGGRVSRRGAGLGYAAHPLARAPPLSHPVRALGLATHGVRTGRAI